jgi:hypothetical protein
MESGVLSVISFANHPWRIKKTLTMEVLLYFSKRGNVVKSKMTLIVLL